MSKGIDKFSKEIHKNNYLNIVFRVAGIVLSLLFTRYNIAYLGPSVYGLWLTIASVSSWASIADLGIGNGLRNELARAIAQGDIEKQRNLIWTAIVLLTKLSVCIFVVLTIVSEILFATDVIESGVRLPMYITNFFFCVSFIVGIGNTIAYSYQISWLTTYSKTLLVAFNLLAVLLLLLFDVTPDLTLYALLMGIGSLLGNGLIILNLRRKITSNLGGFFKGRFSDDYRKSIINVGLQFFVLQLCCLVLYSTDNVIINRLFDSEQVTKYSVIRSVYLTGEGLFAMFLISMWSAVTYASEKGEYSWIRREIRSLLVLWLLYSVGAIVVSIFFNNIVKIWLGASAIYYEPSLVKHSLL